MRKISDMVLLSDMDGTLLGRDGKIPARNLEAIRRFTGNGGRFGIATGRSRSFMLEAAEGLVINAPCVLYNGGALYDHANDRMLHELFLPDEAEAYIRRINKALPRIGAMLVSGDSYIQLADEADFAAPADTSVRIARGTIGMVAKPWYKALFKVTLDVFDEFFAVAEGFDHPGVRFVGTSFTLIEMLPELSSKGYMLSKLLESGYAKRENLVAVGDFYNDTEMIELAGIGATLCDSPDELKQKADLIVGDCDGGAVADVIEHIESLCY